MSSEEYEAEIASLRRQIEEKDALILRLAGKLADASDVLSKVAEKKKCQQACWYAERYIGRRCNDGSQEKRD